MFKKCSVFILSILLFSQAAVALDLDGDGKSDLIMVTYGTDNAISWSYQSSSSAYTQNVTISSFGTKGENVIPGYWTSASTPEIGTVSLNSDKNVTWSVVDQSSTTQQLVLGSRKDTLVSGADFDGDGIYGAAAITKKGAVTLYTNPFSNGSSHGLNFSKRFAKRAVALFVNHDGTKDRLAMLQSKKRGRRFKNTLMYKELDGSDNSVVLNGIRKKVIEASPVATSNNVDNVLVVTRKGRKIELAVFNLSGERINLKRVARKSTVLVGNYLDDAGEEVGTLSGSTFTVYNPVTGTETTFNNLPAFGAYDAVNVNIQRKATVNNGGEDDNDDDSGKSGLDAACPKGIRKVYGGFLWKNEADEKIGAPRAGRPVILFQDGKPGFRSIKIYASNGAKICSAGLKQPSAGHEGVNCNSDHYYVGWSGGCHKTDGQIASAAKKAAGKKAVYVGVKGGKCIGPVTPDSRNGRLTCY